MATTESQPDNQQRFDELHRALQAAAYELRGTLRRAGMLNAAWQWLAVLTVGFVLDLAFGLPVAARWVCLVGLIAFAAVSAFRIAAGQRRFRRNDEWVARAVEERLPDADNALINGVQFGRMMAGRNAAQAGWSEEQTELMRREVERARAATARIAGGASGVVDRGPEKRAARMLTIVAGLWLAAGLIFPGVFLAVMPRLFTPWRDDATPPWSATKFDVQPQGASLRFDDSLTISVATSGQAPEFVDLMTRGRGQSKWQQLEMSGDEANHYSVELQSVENDTQYYVQANTGRSARYWITVARPPVVTGLDAVYRLPKYANRPEFREEVGSQGIHGLQGTQATLIVTSNRALSGGTVTVSFPAATGQAANTLALTPVTGNADQASGRFTIDRPGMFSVDLTATDGQQSQGAAHGKIVLDVNQRPNVWIPQPGHNLLVTAGMKIPVRIEAQDENALASLSLHRTINDLDDSPVGYALPGLLKNAEEEYQFDLGDLGVRAGDVIKYYADAYDNQPGTPNIGVSETYTLTVVTPAQFQQALAQERTPGRMNSESEDMVAATRDLAQQQQALAQQMRDVAAQLTQKPGDPALAKQMKSLAAQEKALQQQAAKLAQQMKEYAESPSSSPFERALKAKVAQAAQSIAAAAKSMQQAAQGGGTPAQQAAAAAQASKQIAQATASTNQVQQAAQQLLKMWPLYNDVERFFALLTAQGELTLHARQFQDDGKSLSANDRAAMSDLADAQDKIEQALVQLQSDFRVHADQAQDQFPKAAADARQIASEIDQRHIPTLMAAARDAFRRADGLTGYQRAADALAQMQAMVHKAQSAQGGQRNQLSDSLGLCVGKGGLGNSLGSMAGMGFGMGMGAGSGMGIGVGGIFDGPNGAPGGSTSVPASENNTPQAYTPETNSMNGTAGPTKMSHRNTIPGKSAPLSPSDVEVTTNQGAKPAVVGSPDVRNFPAEYRKLIADYYRSVANGQ